MITLDNGRIALTLEPDFGARLTSLTDLASGRQWLVPGDCIDGGEAYLGEQARGWDECFPTVGICHHPAWDGHMRDHGLLWGRRWRATTDRDSCTATLDDPRFSFSRHLRLQGVGLTTDYHVTNRSQTTLPYLWSQHALLATTPADRIRLTGMVAMRADGLPFDWPHHPARDLTIIGAANEGFAMKSYGQTPAQASAAIIGPDSGITFDWTGPDVPAFGLWVDYGGWPPGNPVHQVALEPTTAPADDLAEAERIGAARYLAPGETHAWSVHVRMTGSEPGVSDA
jgi:galactose mutarotase-like enzyme